MGWLGAESLLVEVVAEEAEGEDRYCEAVAAVEGVAACELGEDLVVVFWMVSGLLVYGG